MRDLTKGSIVKHLIAFALPLVLGNLFQLTYNSVDSIILGRFAGKEELAAVGTADPVMNLLILGITGIYIGASVLISNFFGAGKMPMVKKEMATMLRIGVIIALVICLIGVPFCGLIVKMLDTPPEIAGMSTIYLRIVLIGMPFTCIYNIYSMALRGIGDANTPVKFLALSSLLNAGLDMVFVAYCGFGVVGAAMATVIAEAVSGIACIIYVYRHVPILHLGRADFARDRELEKKTIQYGFTTALQQCMQPLGKLFIQGSVNSLGVTTIAAYNAVGKIEDFALLPQRSIGNAMMTFTAQNDGANRRGRVQSGLAKGMLIEIFYFGLICSALLLFHSAIMFLFSSEAEIIAEGAAYFKIMSYFYFMSAVTNGIQGYFRGMKHMKITLAGTMTQITIRVITTWIFIPMFGIAGIAFACACGWTVMILLDATYYVWMQRKLRAAEGS